MKNKIIRALCLLSIVTFVACSEDIIAEHAPDNGVINKVSITGADFKNEDGTRSSVSITENGASFLWDEDDVIGIFPNEGDQVSFAMSQGAGTQTATFSGGGWALKSSATYAAYYPHVYENRDMTKIPVSYVGQTQNGNNNTDHIGAYDFMAASVATPSNGAVAFDMQHLGALVQLTISVPEPSTLTKVILSSPTEFTKTGTIDLTAQTPAITADNPSNTFEIALSNVTTTEANENVIVYFMTAPIDLTGGELTARIYFADETIREVEITGKDLQAGKSYKLDANIEANFYMDGVAYMSSAGTLSEIISAEDLKTISSLKIVGKINGSDIITLESMSVLKSLDLSKANIVSGGLPYEYREVRDEDVPVYTENDVISFGMFDNFGFEEIVLPENITSIQSYAFNNCQELTSITIPSNVASIGSSAFENCTSLTSIDLPNSITTIYSKAFYGCSNLESIVIPPVERIYEDTFGFCTSLTRVEIPNTVTRIEEGAFFGCKELQQVTIPNSVTYLSGFQTSGLTDISIPSSVTTIGAHAFDGCENLSTITIPEGVVTIGYDAFYGCTALNGSLVIPNTVTQIGDQAFLSCSGLTSIKLSENLTYIGYNAFRNCSGVSTITLPSKVQTIGNSAFAGMKLTSMTALMQYPEGDDPFWNGEDSYKIPYLYVPSGCRDNYSSNLSWKNYFNSITELQN